jgi:phosphoadenosine phosphosulfate reductase
LYKLAWDLDTRGILLTEENINNIFPPRPVFYEELDLLGFDKFWQYPKVEEPLLWAIGRRYYYEGKLVGEASGGGIFESPQIKVTKEGENLTIKPVDIKKMVTKNQEFLNILINEAIDFIADVYDKYKKRLTNL